ncbi:MAG: DUF2147 domain-containing protein [Hyphomicrobiaceae bacterium]
MSIRDLHSISKRHSFFDSGSRVLSQVVVAAAAITFVCVTVSHPTASLAQNVDPPEIGLWIDDTGQGAVEISRCGRNLCGHIAWLQDPMSKRGGPKRDIYNPKPKNRSNLICGLQIIGKLQLQSNRSWDYGWIYDPKIGQAFDVAIRALSKNKLELHGYKGLKLLGKTFYWTRAKTDLPRCDADNQAAANK